MEAVFRVKISGIHKLQSGISFKEVKPFPYYPSEEEIQEFFDDEIKEKSKSPQFKNSFDWEITVDKVLIPNIK